VYRLGCLLRRSDLLALMLTSRRPDNVPLMGGSGAISWSVLPPCPDRPWLKRWLCIMTVRLHRVHGMLRCALMRLIDLIVVKGLGA